MTRRMRIDDLTALAVPSQPALSPDGARVVYVLRTLDASRTATSTSSGPCRPPAARRAGSPPAAATPPRPGRRTARGSRSSATSQRARARRRRRRARAGHRPAARRRRPGLEPDGDRIAFSAAVDPTAGREGGTERRRWSTRPSTTRPTAPACSARSATSCTWSTSPPESAGSSPTATTPASRPGRPTATRSRSPARSAPTPTSPSRPPCTCSTSTTRRRRRGPSRSEGGIAGTVSFSADGESLLVVGYPGLALGHAHLLRVPLDGGAPVDLTGHLDRNVMPGGPAYPGALPVETADGRLLFCVRDRGCTHLWRRSRRSAVPRRRAAGSSSRALRRRRHRRGRARHPDVVRRDRRARPRDRRRDRAHRPRRQPRRRRAVRPRGARRSPSPTAPRSRPGWSATPSATGPRPLLLDVHGGPHNAWNAAADEMHLYHQELAARGWAVLLVNPRGSDGYGEAFYDGVARRVGRRRRQRLPRADRRSSSPRASPTRTGSRSPATATAAS